MKRGFTLEEIEAEETLQRNQGLGLDHVRELVTKGYDGSIKISWNHKFKITYERTKGMAREIYGLVPPEGPVPHLPSFHVSVILPKKSFVKSDEQPKIATIEDFVTDAE